jgi:hypothetical protein
MSRRPSKPWEARLQDAHRFVAGGPAVGRVLSATPVERQIMVAYGASTGSAPPEGTGGGEPTTVDFTFYPDGNPDFLDAFSFSGWGGSSTSVERPAGVGTGPFLDDSGGDTSYVRLEVPYDSANNRGSMAYVNFALPSGFSPQPDWSLQSATLTMRARFNDPTAQLKVSIDGNVEWFYGTASAIDPWWYTFMTVNYPIPNTVDTWKDYQFFLPLLNQFPGLVPPAYDEWALIEAGLWVIAPDSGDPDHIVDVSEFRIDATFVDPTPP